MRTKNFVWGRDSVLCGQILGVAWETPPFCGLHLLSWDSEYILWQSMDHPNLSATV